MNLYPESIYAIAAPENILKGQVEQGKGVLLEGRSWAWAKATFEKLNSDTKMVLLIANASFIEGVEWAAIIDEIEIVDKTQTLVHFSNLMELQKPYHVGNLIKLSNGEKLDKYYRRSYVPCKLPKAISNEIEAGFSNPKDASRKLTKNQGFSESTTTLAYQLVRTTQNKLREQLLSKWGQCQVTGFKNPKVLRASHIVPWAESSAEERQDINNGLLLVAHLDQLFDSHLISFDNQGRILISKALTEKDKSILGLIYSMGLENLSPKTQSYLKRHRRRFQQIDRGG